jgi:hypothetical protein
MPDPVDCTPESAGISFCNNTDEALIGESTYWECSTAGVWEEKTGDEFCVADGSGDFAYGCIADPNADPPTVFLECGFGPGTPCSDTDELTCTEGEIAAFCLYGRLTHRDCVQLCTMTGVGDDQITYEQGTCDVTHPSGCCCTDADSTECAEF